jgi:hypothetical protein
MPNALAHCTVAAIATGITLFNKEAKEDKQTLAPIGGTALAALCANLPDKLEPAIHPLYRQFFHSAAFALMVSGGVYKLCQWEAQTDGEKLLKFCLIVVGGTYLVHLAMDACTKRSLPLLGKI